MRGDEEKLRLRQEVETRMVKLLDDIGDKLGPERVSTAKDFVEHGEYGVALEFIADWLDEDDIAISRQELKMMESLHRMMGGDGPTLKMETRLRRLTIADDGDALL